MTRREYGYNPENIGPLSELPTAVFEEVAPGVAVLRHYCHTSPQDFEGERCPRCGVNVYDWLLSALDEGGEGIE